VQHTKWRATFPPIVTLFGASSVVYSNGANLRGIRKACERRDPCDPPGIVVLSAVHLVAGSTTSPVLTRMRILFVTGCVTISCRSPCRRHAPRQAGGGETRRCATVAPRAMVGGPPLWAPRPLPSPALRALSCASPPPLSVGGRRTVCRCPCVRAAACRACACQRQCAAAAPLAFVGGGGCYLALSLSLSCLCRGAAVWQARARAPSGAAEVRPLARSCPVTGGGAPVEAAQPAAASTRPPRWGVGHRRPKVGSVQFLSRTLPALPTCSSSCILSRDTAPIFFCFCTRRHRRSSRHPPVSGFAQPVLPGVIYIGRNGRGIQRRPALHPAYRPAWTRGTAGPASRLPASLYLLSIFPQDRIIGQLVALGVLV